MPTEESMSDGSSQQPYKRLGIEEKKKVLPDRQDRQLIILGAIALSVLGVIAYLITRQVVVLVTMNGPLLAIISRDFFPR
jgi:hypothetical protein